jgi:hypothetical protein
MPDLLDPPSGLEVQGYEFVRRGPSARGWSRQFNFAYRCAKCGTIIPADHPSNFDCECGSMFLDIDTGRFGSRLGDQNILAYKRAR